MIKHVFPQSSVRVYSPGTTRNLIVRVDGKTVYEKKVDGKLNGTSAKKMISQIETLSKAWSSSIIKGKKS